MLDWDYWRAAWLRGDDMADPIMMVPPSRPRITRAEVEALLAPFGIDRVLHPLLVLGIRGYYASAEGGENQIGIYDDAIVLVSPDSILRCNGNTDPSRRRLGHGTDEAKGMASLRAPQVCYAHVLGMHHPDKPTGYPALVQRAGHVTVIRDGTPPYEDTGDFGINIHHGGSSTTSSEGCQTIHPDQWSQFWESLVQQAHVFFGAHWWQSAVIPYVLVDVTQRTP